MHQYKIQTIKYRLDWTGLGHGLQTGNLEPTKYKLVYQAIPEKLVKVDKLQTTFEGAEGTKINSIRRKAMKEQLSLPPIVTWSRTVPIFTISVRNIPEYKAFK